MKTRPGDMLYNCRQYSRFHGLATIRMPEKDCEVDIRAIRIVKNNRALKDIHIHAHGDRHALCGTDIGNIFGARLKHYMVYDGEITCKACKRYAVKFGNSFTKQ